MSIISAKNLTKVYGDYKSNQTKAVDDISLSIEEGEFTAVMGPSGSGKSTFISMLSGISEPSGGEVIIDNVNLCSMSREKRTEFRRKKIGFVFQDFNLLNNLTLRENIILPMVFDKRNKSDMEESADLLIKKFGIAECAGKYPYEVSGGQLQRAAVSRALINKPVILFADEPTGNLDSKSSKAVMECFTGINSDIKTTILMVTHDVFAASFCKHVIFIKDGKINLDIRSKGTRKEFFDQILDCQAIVGGERNDI